MVSQYTSIIARNSFEKYKRGSVYPFIHSGFKGGEENEISKHIYPALEKSLLKGYTLPQLLLFTRLSDVFDFLSSSCLSVSAQKHRHPKSSSMHFQIFCFPITCSRKFRLLRDEDVFKIASVPNTLLHNLSIRCLTSFSSYSTDAILLNL